MPNHVTNHLTAPKEILDRLIGKTDEGEEIVDFENIIPIPEIIDDGDTVPGNIQTAAEIALGLIDFKSLQIPGDARDLTELTAQLHANTALRMLFDQKLAKDFSDEEFELFVRYMRSYRETGFTNGLDWARENWGTKWNAYEYERLSPEKIKFETAWSAPTPVIDRLFDSVDDTHAPFEMLHEWADEDTGSNVGTKVYRVNDTFGRTKQTTELDGKIEGYELCLKLRPELKKYAKIEDGKFVWLEDEEEVPA